MTSIEDLQQAEQAMREIIERSGLPEPDDVEYEADGVVLLWHDARLAVIVDLADDPAATDGLPR